MSIQAVANNAGSSSGSSGAPVAPTHTPVAVATPVAPAKQPVSQTAIPQPKETEPAVKQAVAQANQVMTESSRSISFGYEEKLGQLIVKVTNTNNGEVIGEFPSKALIQAQVAMHDMVGLLIDKKG